MELSQNDYPFKTWPSREERVVPSPANQYGPFFNDYQQKEEDRLSEAIGGDTEYARFMLNTQLPIHTFLYVIVKRGLLLELEKYSPYKTFFMDDEALILSIMLKRDGFLDNTGCDKSCVACGTEKLETEMHDILRRQMEILCLARKFYTQPENEDKYNICHKHRTPNTYFPNNDINVAPPCASQYNWLESMQARKQNIEFIQKIIMQTQNNIMRFPIVIPNNIYNYSNYTGYQSNLNYQNQNDMQQNHVDQSYINNYFDSYLNPTPEPTLRIRRQSNFFPDQTQSICESDSLRNYIFAPSAPCENTFARSVFSNNIQIQNDPFNYATDVSVAQNSSYLNNRIKAPPGFAPNNVPAIVNPASNLIANHFIDENYLLNATNHNNIAQLQLNNAIMRNTNMSNVNIPYVNEDTSVRDNTNTVNINREIEQQVFMGSRIGRKIVGKKY